MKKSCPAFQGYPTCRGETTRSPELSRPPRRVRDPDVNGWLILQRNKLKLTSARVTRGEGCLGYPRPYKLALRRGDWNSCPAAYRYVRYEVAVLGKLVLRGTRIVVPQKLREQILDLADEGHQGVVKTK